jgi:hypothetical protein
MGSSMSPGGVSSVAKVDKLVICGKSKCVDGQETVIWYSRYSDHADHCVRSPLVRELLLKYIILQHISSRCSCG